MAKKGHYLNGHYKKESRKVLPGIAMFASWFCPANTFIIFLLM